MSLLFFPEPSTEEQEVRLSVRRLAETLIAPTALEDDRSTRFRRETFNAFAKQGLAALAVPKEYGGGGKSFHCHYAVLEEIAKASVAFGVCVAVNNLIQGALMAHGSRAQKDTYLRNITNGTSLAAFSLSEPQSGSDAASLTCKAVKVAGGYRLTGSKCWCSTGGAADIYLVMTRTGIHKTKGITALLVHKDAPGFRIGKQEKKMGLRASPLSELIFEDCFVPETQRLGEEGDGFSIALSQLDAGRIGIGAVGVGLSTAVIERMLFELKGSFGKMTPFKESISQRFAEHYAKLQSIKLLINTAAAYKDKRLDVRLLAAQIKLLGSDLAMDSSQDIAHFLGEKGCREEDQVERFFRDAKALQIVEGTNQIQKLLLAREMERML